MKRLNLSSIACVTGILAVAIGVNTARAQSQTSTEDSSSPGEQWQTEQNQGQNQFEQGNERTVRGRIQSLRELNLRNAQGIREEHSIAHLRLQDGRIVTADLGLAGTVDELNLEQGDRITVRGHRGTIDGRQTLFADQVRAGDQTLDVARTSSPWEHHGFSQGQFGNQNNSGWQSQNQSREEPEHFTLRGRVTGYQVINLESGHRQVSLLNLRLANGREVLIDAGRHPSLLDLKDLELRDRVVIKGHTQDMNGHEVLVADNVEFLNPEQGNQNGVGGSGQQQGSSGVGSSSSQSQENQPSSHNQQ
jgi:hypothetical protein